jgi:hypothetical protein
VVAAPASTAPRPLPRPPAPRPARCRARQHHARQRPRSARCRPRQPHPHLVAHEFQITDLFREYSGLGEICVHYGAQKTPRSQNPPRSCPGRTYHGALVHQGTHRYPPPEERPQGHCGQYRTHAHRGGRRPEIRAVGRAHAGRPLRTHGSARTVWPTALCRRRLGADGGSGQCRMLWAPALGACSPLSRTRSVPRTLRKCQTLALSSNRHRKRLDIRANLGSNRCSNTGRSR